MTLKKNKANLFLSLLPGLLLFGLWTWLSWRPLWAQHQILQKTVEQLSVTLARQPEEIAKAQQQLSTLQQNIQKTMAEVARIEQDVQQWNHWFQNTNAMDTGISLSELFNKNKILLLESSYPTFSGNLISSLSENSSFKDSSFKGGIKKPEILTLYEKQLEPKALRSEGLFLKLEFQATFLEVCALLTEIEELQLRIFPISLMMLRDHSDKKNHLWQMLLWM